MLFLFFPFTILNWKWFAVVFVWLYVSGSILINQIFFPSYHPHSLSISLSLSVCISVDYLPVQLENIHPAFDKQYFSQWNAGEMYTRIAYKVLWNKMIKNWWKFQMLEKKIEIQSEKRSSEKCYFHSLLESITKLSVYFHSPNRAHL